MVTGNNKNIFKILASQKIQAISNLNIQANHSVDVTVPFQQLSSVQPSAVGAAGPGISGPGDPRLLLLSRTGVYIRC